MVYSGANVAITMSWCFGSSDRQLHCIAHCHDTVMKFVSQVFSFVATDEFDEVGTLWSRVPAQGRPVTFALALFLCETLPSHQYHRKDFAETSYVVLNQ